MRTHPNPMAINPTSFSSVNSGEKAASDRAAAVRRRLIKGAASLDSMEADDETLLVNYWLQASTGLPPHPAEDDSEYPAASSGKDSNLG